MACSPESREKVAVVSQQCVRWKARKLDTHCVQRRESAGKICTHVSCKAETSQNVLHVQLAATRLLTAVEALNPMPVHLAKMASAAKQLSPVERGMVA